MNKNQLQQELLNKVKPGIKPSDLKKQVKNSQPIPTPPPLPSNPSLDLKPELATIHPESPNKNPEPTLSKPFYCPACRTKQKGIPQFIKVAVTDPEYNLIKGKTYSFCSNCSPKIKEFNEYDLITPELWAKYPYSDAKEILESEFGIKEEPW